MKKISLIVVLFLTLLCSCNENNLHMYCKNILVENFVDKEISIDKFISTPTIIRLQTNNDVFIGKIKDVCIIDTSLYILDEITSTVLMFNLNNGILINSMNRKGNGPKEYINPISISSFNNNISILDLATNKVLVLNKNLEEIDEIYISFAALDFIAIENGFLFYNISTENGAGEFVHTDIKGNVINRLQAPNDCKLNHHPGGKIFIQNENGEIYAKEPLSNIVYQWSNGVLKEYFKIDFKDKNIPENIRLDKVDIFDENYAVSCNYFITSSCLINSFLYKKKRYYAFCDLKSDTSESGTIILDRVPFFPQWQYKDYIISIYTEDDFEKDTVIEPHASTIISFFKIK